MYLGLYDISDIPSNPHVEGPGEFYMFRERFAGTDTARTDTIVSNRTYRIKPEIDNTSTTRGADYQMLLRALPYGIEPVEPEEYNGAYVDTTIYKGTEAAADYTLMNKGTLWSGKYLLRVYREKFLKVRTHSQKLGGLNGHYFHLRMELPFLLMPT